MKRQFGQLAVLGIWGAGLALAVLSYNLWACTCAGCAQRPPLVLGLPDYGFMGLIGAALLVLFSLKWRRKTDIVRRQCRCGTLLDKGWNYCPACGSSRKARAAKPPG